MKIKERIIHLLHKYDYPGYRTESNRGKQTFIDDYYPNIPTRNYLGV